MAVVSGHFLLYFFHRGYIQRYLPKFTQVHPTNPRWSPAAPWWWYGASSVPQLLAHPGGCKQGCLVVHQDELLLITRHLKLTFFAPENGQAFPKGNEKVFQASIFRGDNVSFRECILIIIRSTTVDGSEIRRSPVEVGGLSHDLPGFIHPTGGFFGISEPSTAAYMEIHQVSGQSGLTHVHLNTGTVQSGQLLLKGKSKGQKEWHVKVKLGISLLKNVHTPLKTNMAYGKSTTFQ